MDSFDDIQDKINTRAYLVKLSAVEVARLEHLYPELSKDYLRFLIEIGHGNLGNLVIYGAPMDPVSVYSSARSNALQEIVLFGDDMQGFCYGFDLRNGGRIVEIDPRGRIDRTIEPEFIDFLKSFLT